MSKSKNRRQTLIFAIPNYSSFKKPVIKSLERLGYSVEVFDYYKPSIKVRVLGTVKNTFNLNSKLINRHIINTINQQLLTKVLPHQPTYFLTIKGELITSKTIKTLNRLGITTINWFPDWLISWKWIKTHAPAYKFFINSCYDTFLKLKHQGIKNYYLPYAAPKITKNSIAKKYPISFVGQHSLRREEYFKQIADLGLNIWGYSQWSDSDLQHIYRGEISADTTLKILSQSKIVVNILTGTDKFQPAAVNVRTFEALGVGSFLLVKYHPILKKHFKLGKELITFDSPQDLRRKCLYYLKHDAQREQIAKAGYNRVSKDHTFDIRLKQLFDIVAHGQQKT